MRGGRTGLAALFVLSAVALESCGLFQPRPADPPLEDVPIIILSEPDSVYRQIQLGLQTRFISSYINAYEPGVFLFNPDRADSLLLLAEGRPTAFNNWTYDVEQEVHTLILGAGTDLDAVFEPCDLPNCENRESVDVIVTDQLYSLTVDGETFEGIANLTMARNGIEWRIVRWIDRRRPNAQNETWGLLRGRSRGGT